MARQAHFPGFAPCVCHRPPERRARRQALALRGAPGLARKVFEQGKAEADAFYVAHQFYRRKFAAHECEVSAAVKGYLITARARFRIDCHKWEPVLWIKSTRPMNKGAMQAFDGVDSPFHKSIFPTAETAARFALSYGERVALGLVGGLHV
jgi:hypothetical protein